MRHNQTLSGMALSFSAELGRPVGQQLCGHDPTSPNWNHWYETYVPIADDIFAVHLNNLANEQT